MAIDRFEEGWPETPSVRHAPRLKPKLKDFIKGPVCARWLAIAASISKDAIRVGLALWQEAGFKKDGFFESKLRQSEPMRVHTKLRRFYGLKNPNVSRGLAALLKAGLIAVTENSPGRHQIVTILNISLNEEGR